MAIRSIGLMADVEVDLGGNHGFYNPELHGNMPLKAHPDGGVILTRPDGLMVRVYPAAIAFLVESAQGGDNRC